MKNKRKLIFARVLIVLVSAFTAGCVVSYTDLIKDGKYYEAALQCEKQKSVVQKDCYLALADAFFAKEDYDTALQYYRKLDHLSGMAKVKEAYLAKARDSLSVNDFDSAARYVLKSEEKILFEDNFDDNRNGWAEKKSKEVELSIGSGKYNFTHKRNESGWLCWQKNIDGPEPNKDFAIESTITKASGTDDRPYGIFFGVKDGENGLIFIVTGKGHYSFSKMREGKIEGIIENVKSAYINPGNDTNELRIERSGKYFKFYINGRFVDKAPQERLLGNAIGFSADGNMEIEVDNLILSQFPAEQDIYTDLAKKEAIKGKEKTAYQLFTKAGYTSGAAYIHLAEVKFDQEDYEACANYIERAGWSVEDIRRSVIFEDNFDDNKNNWFEKNSEDVRLEIGGGSYIFEKKKPGGPYGTWPQNSIESKIDPSGDFKIESTMTKEAGANNNSYDTVWGLKDINNYDAFGIAGNGHYMHGRVANGKWHFIIDWTNSALIHKENATNVLSIIKSGDMLKFYINDRFVNTVRYQGLIGNKIGFSLNRDMRVRIDHIVATQFPPEIVLSLADKSYEKSGDKKGIKKIADILLAKKLYDKAWEYYGKSMDEKDVAPTFLRALLEESKRVSSVDIAVEKLQRKRVISSLKQILNHKNAMINELAYDAMIRLKAEN